jgi:4-hydroxy-2-oxoheptanedioate aldolase
MPEIGTTSLKERLALGTPVLGTFLQMAEPTIVDVLARSGFDFGVADLEHGALDLRQAIDLARAADLHRFPLLARLPLERLVSAGQLLDSGFAGILVPQVATADEARRAVVAARYPPVGSRGACPGTRSDGFGTSPWQEHVRTADATTTVVVAVESAAGTEAASEICEVSGVDAVFIGVFDLSTSLGVPGQTDHPTVRHAVDHITHVARERGVPVGAWSPTLDATRGLVRKGMTFLPVSTDVLLWGDACRRVTGQWSSYLHESPSADAEKRPVLVGPKEG